jgi:hypothetical protein
MLWGTGETPVKISPSFTPTADYAIQYGRALSGASFRVDRGQASDVHRCTFTVSGAALDVIESYNAIAGQATDGTGSVILEDGEWIFGPATATGQGIVLIIEEVGKLERTGLNSYSFTVTASGTIAYDPAYTAALPTAFIPSLSHSTETALGAVTNRAYTAANTSTTKIPTTFAEFSFQQVMKKADAAKFQMYFETVNRGARIAAASFPQIKGVAYPWGPDYGAVDVYIRSLSFEPMSPSYWRVNVVLQKAQ